MNNNKIKLTQSGLLKVVIGLAALTCYLVGFKVVYAELNERSPEEIRYEKVVTGFVESLRNGQEICNRVNNANNLTGDCDVISESEKQHDIDQCQTINSKEYCETTLGLAYKEYDRQVAEYKNSFLSKTYKFVYEKERLRLTKEFEWADDIKIENWDELSRQATLAKNAK